MVPVSCPFLLPFLTPIPSIPCVRLPYPGTFSQIQLGRMREHCELPQWARADKLVLVLSELITTLRHQSAIV